GVCRPVGRFLPRAAKRRDTGSAACSDGEVRMAQEHRFTVVAAVALTVFALAAPAAGQLTTGTVSGTVKDPHAGIIPGATVTLISERRGTRLPDAITNADGDFVFANVPPDTYTLQVIMEGFKALRRGGN